MRNQDHAAAPSLVRRATNVTLPEALLQEARDMCINVSQACETGLASTVRNAKQQRWRIENQAAIEAWNEFIDREGIPLAEFRQF